MVMIYDPWGKSAPRKLLKFFWLETSKNDHSRGGWVLSKNALFPRIGLLFSRIALLFFRSALLLPGITLLFSELSVCFPKGHFHFWKMLYCFPEFPFSFLEGSSFFSLLRVFFQEYFFSNWLYLLILLRATQRDNICLALVLLPLGTLYWLNYDAFLINLKPLHAEWFFCVIYSNFGLHDSLENTVSEHLE